MFLFHRCFLLSWNIVKEHRNTYWSPFNWYQSSVTNFLSAIVGLLIYLFEIDFMRGGSIAHPPLLDESNYAFWKIRMKAFIKAVDEKAWRAVLISWEHPTKNDDKGAKILKPKLK